MKVLKIIGVFLLGLLALLGLLMFYNAQASKKNNNKASKEKDDNLDVEDIFSSGTDAYQQSKENGTQPSTNVGTGLTDVQKKVSGYVDAFRKAIQSQTSELDGSMCTSLKNLSALSDTELSLAAEMYEFRNGKTLLYALENEVSDVTFCFDFSTSSHPKDRLIDRLT